jgi:hypothetical protein
MNRRLQDQKGLSVADNHVLVASSTPEESA